MALGQLVVRLGLDATDFVQGMSRAEAESQRLARQMAKDLSNAIGVVTIGLGALALAGKFAFDFINNQNEATAKFQDLAEKVGDTAENFASLKKASDVSGVSMDEVAAASVKLTAALSKTDDEGQGAAKAIKALGLNFDDFKKKSPADQMDAIAKALAGFKDGSEKTALAVALLGKNGAALLPFFNDLADGAERQISLTSDQIKAANDFSEAMAKLGSDTNTLKQQLVAQLIPTFNDLLKAFTDTGKEASEAGNNVKPFADAMEFIRQEIKRTVADTLTLASGFSQLFTFIGGYAKVSGQLLKGNFDEAKAIGASVRAEIEATSQKYDILKQKALSAGDAGRGKGFADPRLLNSPAEKPVLPFSGIKDKKEPKAKAETNKTSEADRYLEALEKQIQKVQHLTEVEKLRDDIAKGRIAGITKEHETKMLAAAIEIDTIKQYEDGIKKASENEIKANDARKKIAEENTKRLQDEATLIEGIRQSMLTDVQKLEEEQIKLNDLMQTVETVEQFEILLQKYDELGVKIVELKKPISEWEEAGKQAASSLVDGLADAIIQGKSLADVFKNVVKQLAVMILKAILFRAISGVVESFTGINISGAKAGGGNVNQNSTYMVGEKGPELFTPSQSGRITTNSNVMKDTGTGNDSGKTNVYNISAGGVSREEFTAGLNRTQAGAVSDVRQNRLRRRA
jgi:hypothetical protein